jgi:hypothetical protein
MAYEQAVQTGLFMAALADPAEQVRQIVSSLKPSAKDRRYKRSDDPPGQGLLDDASSKAHATLQAKLYKLSHKKFMTPIFKNLHRFRMIASFSPQQMKNFIFGVAVSMHLFTHYSKRGGQVHADLKRIFLLVFLPFMMPAFVVLGIPFLLFMAPLLLVSTAFTGLNRQAKQIQYQNDQRNLLQQLQLQQYSVERRIKNMWSSVHGSLHGSVHSRSSRSSNKLGKKKHGKSQQHNNQHPSDQSSQAPSTSLGASLRSQSSFSQRKSFLRLRRPSSSSPELQEVSSSIHPPVLTSSDVSITNHSLDSNNNNNHSKFNLDILQSNNHNKNNQDPKEQAPDKPRRASFRISLIRRDSRPTLIRGFLRKSSDRTAAAPLVSASAKKIQKARSVSFAGDAMRNTGSRETILV